MRYLILAILFVGLSSTSCKKEPNQVEATGVLQVQGITTYQYGTHVIPGYALRSGTIDLDQYVGQTVTVRGHLIDGYPVENGPDYMEVEEVL